MWSFVVLSAGFVLGLGLGIIYCWIKGTTRPQHMAPYDRAFNVTAIKAYMMGTGAALPLLALGVYFGTFSLELPTSGREVLYDILKVIPLWIGSDLLAYFYHRYLEHDPRMGIFYRAHNVHHEYVYSGSPLTGFHTHWLEMLFTTQLGSVLFILLPGSTIFCFAAYTVAVGFVTMTGHCDIDDKMSSRHHRLHHTDPETNYSETWEIIDLIFGTKIYESERNPPVGTGAGVDVSSK